MILYPPFLKRGITIAPWLILVPRWAKGNKSYLAHELIHAEQQRKMGVLTFWFKYITKAAFRQAMEVEAYKAQIKAGASAHGCATSLATKYRINLSIAQANKELSL